MSTRAERLWIVWERQRRSEELARRLRCETHVFDYRGGLRYPKCVLQTIAILLKRRPKRLFVQNPSMVLAALACVYGFLTRAMVVVDRHTTFALNKPKTLTPRRLVFLAFHHFTLRGADRTIVTNEALAELVRRAGGEAFVLPDPIPQLTPTGSPRLPTGKRTVLVISSFGYDEPIAAVLEAADRLRDNVRLYVTGNPDKATEDWRKRAPDNLEFTGFVPAEEFVNLLFGVDAVMVLTTADHTMLCGCYEAVAAAKPLVTSDKMVLRDYFIGAEFVAPTPEGIAAGLRRVLDDPAAHAHRIRQLRERLVLEWETRFQELEALVGPSTSPLPGPATRT